jgi:glycosyltransferase involved in cell wall biosynthesis
MKLSVIIPAFNEEKRISSCLEHLIASLNAHKAIEHEIIVVDNNSTDATAEIARRAGVQVLFEPVNQISRARNAGVAVASGDWLVFLDADTLVSAGTINEMLALIRTGKYAGGGTRLRYDHTPLFWRGFLLVSNYLVMPWLGWTAGCFLFCRNDAFQEFGGFNEKMFAAEDVEFGNSLRRWAKPRSLKTVLLRDHPPVTSIRKIELYGTPEIFLLILRFLFLRQRTTRDKTHLRVFYDGRR